MVAGSRRRADALPSYGVAADGPRGLRAAFWRRASPPDARPPAPSLVRLRLTSCSSVHKLLLSYTARVEIAGSL